MRRLGNLTIFDNPDIDGYFFTQPALAPVAVEEISTEPATEQAKAEGVMMFADWLQRNFPDLHKRVVFTMPDSLLPEFALAGMHMHGFGEDQAAPVAIQTSWGDRVFGLIEQVLPQYAAYQNQRELLKINIGRAERGQPPLELGDIAPQVRVGMTDDTKNLLIFGGLGLAALVFFAGRKRA